MRLLLQALAPARGHWLWMADEQVDGMAAAAAPVRAELTALSNRCDVAARLNARGLVTALTDFDIGALPTDALAGIAVRIAKEKALVHHLINAALECLNVCRRADSCY
jgi:16S rRNA (guanine1207-N2)-methyltransferase